MNWWNKAIPNGIQVDEIIRCLGGEWYNQWNVLIVIKASSRHIAIWIKEISSLYGAKPFHEVELTNCHKDSWWSNSVNPGPHCDLLIRNMYRHMPNRLGIFHSNDVIMDMMASQNTSLTIVYSTIYSGTNQRKHQSSPSVAFVMGIHRWPVNSTCKRASNTEMFPFDDVILKKITIHVNSILFGNNDT